MARSLSQAKLLAASFTDGLSFFISRRGFAAASHGSVSASFGRGGGSRVMGKVEERGVTKEESSAWGPDPVTGYYRPNNHAAEIDAAELREMLLNHKVRQH